VLIIHGNRDRVARFGPTETHPRTGRFCEDFPAKAQVDFWVRGQHLPAKARQIQDGKNGRVRVERYGPAQAGPGSVEFVIVKGGGHAWPGGAYERYRYCDLPTPDPDATSLVWDFFKRQTRPAKAAAPHKPVAKAKGKG
jgi:poly(3-hydroxybutyrate) depolymerase